MLLDKNGKSTIKVEVIRIVIQPCLKSLIVTYDECDVDIKKYLQGKYS